MYSVASRLQKFTSNDIANILQILKELNYLYYSVAKYTILLILIIKMVSSIGGIYVAIAHGLYTHLISL